ncbi:site-specific tyrosine recombinase/integron integrase [Clostridium omnivorum]|uniref:Phage integrase n=1 Tax=Clostridium omnivorum TaxID=1604902 RepID=A0ABQ5NCZ4_9CLOT|nr:site-specific tyrosine recombinase/integron integrase [Clostridium sp. E14]GLC32931.1 phage integrase [Clostridium sp. E14]
MYEDFRSNCNEEVIIKIIGKTSLEYPMIDQQKLREILYLSFHNYNVLPIEKSLVASDVEDRIMMYLAVKKLDGLSAKTLKNYKLELFKLSNTIIKPVNLITTNDLRYYLAIRGKNLKSTSLSTVISYLKSFFDWMHQEEFIERDPTRKIKQPKKEKRLRHALTIDEIERLRDACNTVRQRALLETLYATACRLSEIKDLNIDDINFSTLTTRVIGKGNKERIVYLNAKSKLYLQKYLNTRTDKNSALFVSTKHPYGRLGVRAIEREISKIGEQAKIQKQIYPHILRHSFATHALASGMTLDIIQRILGHSDPATTQIYSALNDTAVQQEYKKLNF